jgi:hypothetical protein
MMTCEGCSVRVSLPSLLITTVHLCLLSSSCDGVGRPYFRKVERRGFFPECRHGRFVRGTLYLYSQHAS